LEEVTDLNGWRGELMREGVRGRVYKEEPIPKRPLNCNILMIE
jgi:hypothetical protein